jgi:hypothetical protein
VNTRATLGLTAGALTIGLLAGLGLGHGGSKSAKILGPGPTKTVAGVAVGYQHSREGAINAALGYEATLGTLRHSPANAREAALTAMAAPDQRDEIIKSAEGAYAFFDNQFGDQGIVRGAVLGYVVKAYEPGRAEVEVWEVSIVGRPETIPVRSGWSTRTIQVRWANGDWKLQGLPAEVQGPTPQENGTASDPAQVIETARRLEEVRFATAALH